MPCSTFVSKTVAWKSEFLLFPFTFDPRQVLARPDPGWPVLAELAVPLQCRIPKSSAGAGRAGTLCKTPGCPFCSCLFLAVSRCLAKATRLVLLFLFTDDKKKMIASTVSSRKTQQSSDVPSESSVVAGVTQDSACLPSETSTRFQKRIPLLFQERLLNRPFAHQQVVGERMVDRVKFDTSMFCRRLLT